MFSAVQEEYFSPNESNYEKGDLRKITNDAFKRGEIISYNVHYGFIDAGLAVIQVKEENKLIAGRSTYHIIGTGVSTGSFDWFFKVRDQFETYIDEDALIPWIFIRRTNEGGYIISQNYVFNHYKKTVDADGTNYTIPENCQDMLSAFYAARNLDFSNAKKGDVFSLNSFLDKEIWPVKIKFIGKETIKIGLGKFRCMKFHPVVQKGRVFKSEDDLTVWITDDKNKIPVRAQAKILVGSIKMDLNSYSGLANPISKIEK